MASPIQYAINSCIQYNEQNDLDALGYVCDQFSSGRKFLTNSPDTITLHELQRYALYYLSEPDHLYLATYKQWDRNGNLLATASANLGPSGPHNSIPITIIDFPGLHPDLYRMEVYLESYSKVTISKNFIINRECLRNSHEIWWLNNRGGMESTLFNSLSDTTVEVDRSDTIKLAPEINNFSPNRVYKRGVQGAGKSFRTSARTYSLEEAEWLREDILTSRDVYVRDGTNYLPLIVENGSIQNKNSDKTRIVTFDFRYAFDINIQR